MFIFIPSTETSYTVSIDYTNWKGVREWRKIIPQFMWWGSTQYHKEPQFLLKAWDITKEDMRDFAIKNIHDIVEEFSFFSSLYK